MVMVDKQLLALESLKKALSKEGPPDLMLYSYFFQDRQVFQYF